MENLIAVLQYLEDGNEHLFTETANECGIEAGSATKTIESLVASGQVIKLPDPLTRNPSPITLRVQITASGIEMLHQYRRELDADHHQIDSDKRVKYGLILSGIAAGASIGVPVIALCLSRYLSNLN